MSVNEEALQDEHWPRLDPEAAAVLERRARIPQHVVLREFPQETVVLNLDTGRYHGVNPTGGRMIKALESSDSVRDAVTALAEEFPDAGVELEHDVCHFCLTLSERGLLELG